jgi:glycosyltransferase involved in cell wall biosynthesis
MAKTSVIISTYNRPDALAAVLEGFRNQSKTDFEVVIADDGSTQDTADLIGHLARQMPFAVRHVWQEDKGFRAAAARNRAIAASSGDYLIFVDGDCIPFPDFITTHLRLAESGLFVAGNRILMNPSFTRRVLAEELPVHSWAVLKWVYARIRGWINRRIWMGRGKDL